MYVLHPAAVVILLRHIFRAQGLWLEVMDAFFLARLSSQSNSIVEVGSSKAAARDRRIIRDILPHVSRRPRLSNK